MFRNNILIFTLYFLVVPVWAFAQTAAAPATAPSPYCVMVGKVQNLLKGQGVNAQNAQISVPVALVEVESNVPVDPNAAADFCSGMVGQAADGARPLVHFRVCDTKAVFYTSDRIRAVAGRNLGGGYYCIDQITRTVQ